MKNEEKNGKVWQQTDTTTKGFAAKQNFLRLGI